MCKDISHSQIGVVELLCCISDSRHAELKVDQHRWFSYPRLLCCVQVFDSSYSKQVPRTQYTAVALMYNDVLDRYVTAYILQRTF